MVCLCQKGFSGFYCDIANSQPLTTTIESISTTTTTTETSSTTEITTTTEEIDDNEDDEDDEEEEEDKNVDPISIVEEQTNVTNSSEIITATLPKISVTTAKEVNPSWLTSDSKTRLVCDNCN